MHKIIIAIGQWEMVCLWNGYHTVDSLDRIDLKVRGHYISMVVRSLWVGLGMEWLMDRAVCISKYLVYTIERMVRYNKVDGKTISL